MATSIASKISLALAVKLKALFEPSDKKDKFLSFPKGVAFTYEFLKFMLPPGESGLSAVTQQNYKCEFARIMNVSFEDSPQFLPDASTYLWDSYEDILKSSSFPESTLTDQEEKQLSEAAQFLRVTQTGDEGPLTVPSAAYNEYIRYKSIVDKAEATYSDEKESVEKATGPEGEAQRAHWREQREKQLLDLINQSKNDWLTFGQKTKVESYMALLTALEEKKYAVLATGSYLNDLNQSDVPDLNANGISTKLTAYSPYDLMDKSIPWTSIHLTKDEINAFSKQAPPELTALFDSGEGDDEIEAVSLEYNIAVAIRPWFKPDGLKSSYWKLPDNSPGNVVSDGLVPCRGKLPVYISSMIVGRNITVTRRPRIQATTATPLVLPILSTVSLKNATPVSSHLNTGQQASMMLKNQRSEPLSTQTRGSKLSTTTQIKAPTASMARRLRADASDTPAIAVRQKPVPKLNYASLKLDSMAIATPTIKIPTDTVTDRPPTSIDLMQLAGDPQSRWAGGQLVDEHNTTDHANLQWMDRTRDPLGSTRLETNVTMEDGSSWPSVLHTHPKWVARGTIKGWLAWRTIPAGAHFQAKVGFIQGALGTDGVTFWVWVHYLTPGIAGNIEQWKPVAQHFKKYTQSLDTIDIDLSAYAGQSISIELRVDAGPSSGQDWAAWVNPSITAPQANSGTSPNSDRLVTETFNFDGVFVLAFMCKRLPKAPNPDLTLKWP